MDVPCPLPPFYAAVLDAWRIVDGHASADFSHLFIGGPTAQVPVSNILVNRVMTLC